MTNRLRHVWRAALGVGLLAGSVSAAADEQDIERLTQEVRRAVAVRTGPADDAVLFALRGLRDERLRPLFAEMASREDPAVQLHGMGYELNAINERLSLGMPDHEEPAPEPDPPAPYPA